MKEDKIMAYIRNTKIMNYKMHEMKYRKPNYDKMCHIFNE